MRRTTLALTLAAVALTAAAAGLWLGYGAGRRSVTPRTTADAKKEKAQVRVRAEPIRQGSVAEDLTLYGTVLPAANSVHVYALPFQVITDRVWVTPGQQVNAGDPLVDAHTSPLSAAEVRRARQAVQEARALLTQVEARFASQLATRDEVIGAKARLRQVETTLSMAVESGQSRRSHTLRALRGGVVTRLAVRAGTIAPGSATLLETADRASLQVRLLAETEDVPFIQVGMAVKVKPVEATSVQAATGKVTLVAKQVDPLTRLVFVFVSLSGSDPLFVNQYVRGRLHIASKKGLVVPRKALVPRGSSYRIFTVDKGRARAHRVTVGSETPRRVLVTGDGLAPGQLVVVQGAHWLREGVQVLVEP